MDFVIEFAIDISIEIGSLVFSLSCDPSSHDYLRALNRMDEINNVLLYCLDKLETFVCEIRDYF